MAQTIEEWPPIWQHPGNLDISTQLEELTAHVHACIEMIAYLLAQGEHRQYEQERG